MSLSRRMLTPFLLVVALGCGKSKSPTGPSNTNHAPVIGTLTVSPTFGVSGLTTINMSAAATDSDGDALTYAWSFGSSTASGTSASAKITGDGPVSVKLTVTDSKGSATTDSRTVTIGTITGSWDFAVTGVCGDVVPDQPAVFVLTQTGTRIDGALNFPGRWCAANAGTHGELSQNSPGSIDDQGNVSMPRVPIGSFGDMRLANGKMDSTGRKITGNAFDSGFSGEAFVMTKK